MMANAVPAFTILHDRPLPPKSRPKFTRHFFLESFRPEVWRAACQLLSLSPDLTFASHHERVWPQHQLGRSLQVLPNVRLHVRLVADGRRAPQTCAFAPRRSHSTQVHLKKVYSCLAACMFLAAAGAYTHVVLRLFQVLWTAPTCKGVMWLQMRVNPTTSLKRMVTSGNTWEKIQTKVIDTKYR